MSDDIIVLGWRCNRCCRITPMKDLCQSLSRLTRLGFNGICGLLVLLVARECTFGRKVSEDWAVGLFAPFEVFRSAI